MTSSTRPGKPAGHSDSKRTGTTPKMVTGILVSLPSFGGANLMASRFHNMPGECD